MDLRLKRFRRRLRKSRSTISPLALDELEKSAERLVRLYLGKPKRLRPSAVARELKAMAKSLKRAAGAAERLGDQGMIHLFAASHTNTENEDLDPSPHIEYLSRMARWAGRAAETSIKLSSPRNAQRGYQKAGRWCTLYGVVFKNIRWPPPRRWVPGSRQRRRFHRYERGGVWISSLSCDSFSGAGKNLN
jgi:hypothetical protein